MIAVALSQAGRALGRLELASPCPLTPLQRRMLDLLARQAALALERCQLAQQAIAADRLAQADQLKATLLAAVAHEVKTPLTSLRAASEELSDPHMAWSPADVATFATVIAQETRRLDTLLTALLDHARIRSGVLDVTVTPVDLVDLIATALQGELDALVHHRVQVDLRPALPLVRGDAVLLARALGNLLRNAGRHTPPGTTVTVRAGVNDAWAVVAVIDAGPGLPRPNPSGPPRVGLGLSICAGIVAAHGGTLALEATQGGGLTAIMRWPVACLSMR